MAVCYHCGTPSRAPARWTTEVDGRQRAFCCAGCQAVAETVRAAGLTQWYAAREAPAACPPRAPDDEMLHWGATAELAGLVGVRPDGGREVALLLDGITCAACVTLLDTWLRQQPGVAHVEVNYATRRARVAWDPKLVDLVALLRAIAALGYSAYPYDPQRYEALARRERRSLLARTAVAWLAMMQVMMFALPGYMTDDGITAEEMRLLGWASFVVTLPALFYSAAPILRNALRAFTHRRIGMDVPIALGLVTAFGASAWSTFGGGGPLYYDSVTMFVALLLLARYGELVARQRAGAALEIIARQRPETGERLRDWPASEATDAVPAAGLARDDVVLVRAGARVPADGAILDGRSHVEEALLTGESHPQPRGRGERVWAGSLNRDHPLVVRVTAAGEATRLAAVLRLTERATGTRPRIARVADRIAAYFVAVLLVITAMTALVWWQIDPARVLPVIFAVLVVSCPCALALATPAALAAATGALARRGVVLARGEALETLARVTHVVLDKTGTLTEGRVRLADVATVAGTSRASALGLAVALEARTEHPVGRALRDAAVGSPGLVATDLRHVVGAGVEGRVGGRTTRVGSPAFVSALAGAMPEPLATFAAQCGGAATLVGLGDERGWRGLFALSDTLRAGAPQLVADLRSLGIEPVLLSGDGPASVAAAATTLGIRDARAQCTPEDKRTAIAALQAQGAVVAMIGDGVNDAPALAQAQVSLSLGSATPLAQWTADVVVLAEDIARVGEVLRTARRTLAVIRQNLTWALLYNLVAIPAAVLGFVTPLVAAAGMSVSSLAVVGNALRLGRHARAVSDAHATVAAQSPAGPEIAWKS